MQLFDMFGEPPQFTVHEMTLVLRSGIFLKYAVAVMVLLTAFDTHGYRQAGMPLIANALLWGGCVVSFISVYASVLLFWFAMAPGGRQVRLLRFVPNALAMGLVTVLVVGVASGFTSMEFGSQVMLQHVPYNIVLSYTFETLFFVFILPNTDASLGLGLYRRQQPKPGNGAGGTADAGTGSVVPAGSEPPSRLVVLGGRSFALEDLRYVKSEEHYLRVATRTGQQTLRGRMGDLVAQVPCEAGLQPHRSWWVARAALAALKRGSQGDVLLLEEGVRVPVARGRRAEVRETAKSWNVAEH